MPRQHLSCPFPQHSWSSQGLWAGKTPQLHPKDTALVGKLCLELSRAQLLNWAPASLSQALSELGPSCPLSLLQSPYSETPQHKKPQQNMLPHPCLLTKSREVSTGASPVLKENKSDRVGPGFGTLLGKQDRQDSRELSLTERVPHQNNIIHLRSFPAESDVSGGVTLVLLAAGIADKN